MSAVAIACKAALAESFAGPLTVVGLMSGTSVDAIDVAICRVSPVNEDPPTVRCLYFTAMPFPPNFRANVLEVSPGYPLDPYVGSTAFTQLSARGSVADVCRYNALIGQLFAEATLAAIAAAGLTVADIDLIGSHGQTIHHLPAPTNLFDHTVRSTLQVVHCGTPF
jgi:anhydro-N-acetylmuramic acid kinase